MEGFYALMSPVLELRALEDVVPDLEGIRNLVFTRANGVCFFMQAVGGMTEQVAGLTAWCVGPATTRAARDSGFGLLKAGHGNADDLADLILSSSGPEDGGFLHIANSAAAGQLVAQLTNSGRDVRFQALYEAVWRGSLAPEARTALIAPDISFVLIHSAKGAEAFKAALSGVSLGSSVLVAISDAAARPLEGCGAAEVRIASQPNEEALMMALKTAHLRL